MHGEICEYAPKDMPDLHEEGWTSIVLDGRQLSLGSAICNVGMFLTDRHSAVRQSIKPVRIFFRSGLDH